MKFLILSKKGNFDKSLINDSLLDSINAPSLIANDWVKKESGNLIVYLYTYNMAYNEREGFSYILRDDEINFVNGLFAIENMHVENNIQNLNDAINEDKLILGNYQTFYCDNEGNGYLKSSLSAVHPLFLYEDDHCTVLSNELKLIVDGVKSFHSHKFVDLYDMDYIQDIFRYGQWYKGSDKSSYRNTVFKNITRLFPFDDIKIKNGHFDIELKSGIIIPEWFEKLYLDDREQFYDEYYSYLENYTDSFLKTISENLTQITLGLTGGFDSRLTAMMLSEFCPKYGIKLQAITNGIPGHPDVQQQGEGGGIPQVLDHALGGAHGGGLDGPGGAVEGGLLRPLVGQQEADVGHVAVHRGDAGVHIHVVVHGHVVEAVGGDGDVLLADEGVDEAGVVDPVVVILLGDDGGGEDPVHPGGDLVQGIVGVLPGAGVEEDGPDHVPAPEEAGLCGVINKFLTNYEDLMAVYSFGLQIDVTMQP